MVGHPLHIAQRWVKVTVSGVLIQKYRWTFSVNSIVKRAKYIIIFHFGSLYNYCHQETVMEKDLRIEGEVCRIC